MTEQEFSLLVNLFRNMSPGITSRSAGVAARNFKSLCGHWNVDVNTEQMSRLPNLLINAGGTNVPHAKSQDEPGSGGFDSAVATADDGSYMSNSGGPVAQ